MTQLTEHAKTILRAIADGKTIERQSESGYIDITSREALAVMARHYEEVLRIAPETRSINSVVFAAPVEKSDDHYSMQVFNSFFWFKDAGDRITAAQAIIDALEGKTKS